jgi:protease-4
MSADTLSPDSLPLTTGGEASGASVPGRAGSPSAGAASADKAPDAPDARHGVSAGDGADAARAAPGALSDDESGNARRDAPRPPRGVNPKWSRKAEEFEQGKGKNTSFSGASLSPAAQAGSDGVGSGGAWIWLPHGPGPKPSWRKRHPVLFWGGVILLLGLVFGWGRMSVENTPISGPRIAVVNVEGIILDASSVVSWMEKVRREDAFKGAIIRINSPGGAVGPSQEIYAAVKRLAARKPVVASLGALAASGGYYAALGAPVIMAGPSTVTASIGVKMQLPNISELMRTIGISETTLTTGKLKDAGNSWRDMTPEEEAYFRALIGDMYDEFVQTVARERDMPVEKARALADGRAMTGRQALEAGLVDALGDLYVAAQSVGEKAGLKPGEARLVEGPEKPRSWLGDLAGAAVETVLSRGAVEQPLFMY